MDKTLARDLVAGFDALFGEHAGVRAAHAKGICGEATFTATPEAAALTRAPHMQGTPVRATVRFSHGSGDPTAHDGGREPRGMAVKFHLDEKRSTDIVSINQPVFITRTPEEFLEFVRLRKPDPATGQPDLAALGAFVGARPESVKAAQMLLAAVPLASFLTAEYFAIHAFRFVAADGTARFGKYRWEPGLGIASLTSDEAKERGAHYLRDDLIERLEKEPATFNLHIHLAGEGDNPDDPTEEWAADRESILAGHLEITAPAVDQEACEAMLFDPTRLCDGIETSNDPILAVRPHAYVISSKRRAGGRT
jgi:catalase